MGSTNSSHQLENEVPAFKVVLVGAPKSGKSSVFLRYIRNQHVPYYTQTRKPVIENVVRKLNIPGHAIVSVTLWDLPGREDLDLRSTYFRNVDAAIVVVDMSDEESIEMASVWRREILNQATYTQSLTSNTTGLIQSGHIKRVPIQPDEIPIILLGNKYDIVENEFKSVEEEEDDSDQQQLSDSPNITDKENDNIERQDVAWNFNPSFPPQRGPKPEEKKPPTVKLLEKVCEENNFTASLMVSCKDNDGSVEKAIQSLIRYLVINKYPDTVEKWRPIEKPLPPNPASLLSSELETVGIPTLDKIFTKCGEIIKQINFVCKVQDTAFTAFQGACFELGVSDSRQSNLEDCIQYLKEAFPEDTPLQIVDGDGFYHLEVLTTREINLQKDIKNVFDVFNLKFAVSSRVILKDFTSYESMLKTQQDKVHELCEQLDFTHELDSNPDCNLKQSQWKVERNLAKIGFTRDKALTACEKTKILAEKIHLAMLW